MTHCDLCGGLFSAAELTLDLSGTLVCPECREICREADAAYARSLTPARRHAEGLDRAGVDRTEDAM